MKLNKRKLRSLIKARGLTIEAFALAIGLKSRNGVYDIFKRDGIKTTQLQKICEVLNIDSSEIIISELGINAKQNSTNVPTKGKRQESSKERDAEIERLEHAIKRHEDNFDKLMRMYERLADSYDRLSGLSSSPPVNQPTPKTSFR